MIITMLMSLMGWNESLTFFGLKSLDEFECMLVI